MALNLTPQYHSADAKYRAARTPEDKLAALEEMWRELPKHKASEKMQAELKKKLSAIRADIQKGSKKTAGKLDPFAIPKAGAGQIVCLGPPNGGKSSIVGALTKAQVKIAEFPFSTPLPLPGMVTFEDVKFELIDTPPITVDHVPPGFAGLWHSADVLLVVVDLSSDEVLEDVEMCLNHLSERHIELTDNPACPLEQTPDAVQKKTGILLATRLDAPAAADNLDLLREFFASRVRIEPLSTHDPADVARLPRLLFDLLGVIRIYAKPPGKKVEQVDPFVLPAGATVNDMARKVHRGMAEQVKSARIWGETVFDGQNVQLDHVLHDKDTVELHA
ncbi:MAG: TGS domain-containing protein [Planctomycetes bacterium]|nr:TGS domain-containing protein [Planctomycetota bacterium]